MEGLIRSLAIPWLFRQFGYRDWGRYNEVHGLPIRGVIEPSEWADEDKQKALVEVARLASESVIRLPQNKDGQGFDLKLIEATAQTYDSFKLGMEQANASIAIVVLGQNLTSEVKGGAYAAAQVHERVAAAIIRSDATTLSGALRSQVLVEWAALNHGPKADGKAPRPAWDTEPPEDKKGTAEAVKTGAEGLVTLRKSRLPVDFAKVCERLGIPLIEGAEIPEFEEEPPAGPGDDKEDDDLEEDDRKERKALARARADTGVIRAALSTSRIGRRDRAPLQGQAYVDEVALRGRDMAARILAGDVRALKRVLSEAQPGPDGKIDAAAMKAALLAAYAEMKPDDLADALQRCRLLAELSGRYSLVKEAVSK
jgi:phage gp29-like protein